MAMSLAPHAHESPSRAAARPLINTVESPAVITVGPCPGIGQVTASPTQAMDFWSARSVDEPPVTMPPWSVESPIRMKGFIFLFSSA